MFAIDGPGSEYSIHQLKEFLDKKVKEHKLVFSGGIFRLPKPESWFMAAFKTRLHKNWFASSIVSLQLYSCDDSNKI